MDASSGFGLRLARNFGLPDAPSLATPSAGQPRFAVTRIARQIEAGPLELELPREDKMLVLLFLIDLDRLEMRRMGEVASAQACARGSIGIFDLEDGASFSVEGQLDCLAFAIAHHAMRGLADRIARLHARGPSSRHLHCPLGCLDPTVEQIGLAVLPLLRSPERMAPAFLDHIGLALITHLIAAYGRTRPDH